MTTVSPLTHTQLHGQWRLRPGRFTFGNPVSGRSLSRAVTQANRLSPDPALGNVTCVSAGVDCCLWPVCARQEAGSAQGCGGEDQQACSPTLGSARAPREDGHTSVSSPWRGLQGQGQQLLSWCVPSRGVKCTAGPFASRTGPRLPRHRAWSRWFLREEARGWDHGLQRENSQQGGQGNTGKPSPAHTSE